jgi:outer membrane protein assembly factor BamB
LIGDIGQRRIFMLTDTGIAHYVEAESGKHLWMKRIGSEYSASPLFADGFVWCFDEKGICTVLRVRDDKPEIVSENALDDGIMGTPAISGHAIFIRTKTALYRIEAI